MQHELAWHIHSSQGTESYQQAKHSTQCNSAGTELAVQELVLGAAGSGWSVTRQSISIGEKCVFAPANLRATADNAAYKQLVHGWMDARHTLRYSGGMVRMRTALSTECSCRLCNLEEGTLHCCGVQPPAHLLLQVPDVHHILTAGGGVFCSPASDSAKAKLRLLYECAPLAFVVEAAGGASHSGHGSVLDQRIDAVDTRTVISLGSHKLVMQSVASLKNMRAILF